MCESIIACVSLTLHLLPSFSLLCFCSTLCLTVIPMLFFIGVFPFFFLLYFLFLLYSGFSFFTFLSTHFSSRLVYNFCFAWLLLSLTRTGWPGTLLTSQNTPRVGDLRMMAAVPLILGKKE